MRRFLFLGRGRLDRLGYLAAVLAALLLFVLPPALLAPGVYPEALRWPDPEAFRTLVLGLGAMLWIAVAWIYGGATVRRLHDANLTGWLALLALIPAVGAAGLTVALLLLPGTPGDNRFGKKGLLEGG